MKRDRRKFFLALGQLNAPIRPVRWLGIKSGESWRTFGWTFTACTGLAILISTALSVSLSSAALVQAVPLILFVPLFAALNAFTEEVYYRSSMLSTLHGVVGDHQATLMNVVFFGLAHYLNGTPPGMLGCLLTGFLAFLLCKAMLETRGMFWSWMIHFVPDAVIFFGYALSLKS